MSINGVGGEAALLAFLSAPGAPSAGNTAAASVAAGSGDGGLIANVDAAASGVSAALQSVSSALGSIIDVTV